jgi:DNA modification methylase
MLIRGDARALPVRDGCVSCVVTSPPYWGLRDYGVRGQLGLESTPEAYVAALVAVFREVRRVLRDDGTAWVNLGDSYATNRNDHDWLKSGASAKRGWHGGDDLKPKDLCGIPWRVAFALQADGWYLRSDIIWSKPNPMPESVTDRPTKAHEYLFLLAKSARYYYDADAIAEASIYGGEQLGIVRGQKRRADAMGVLPTGNERPGADADIAHTRNKRSVWHIATQPYAGAHFATMPEPLIAPCILAGCPLGGLVLDPFCGTGTVGAVASRLGRRWVGVDLTYQGLARTRTAQRGLVFTEASA